MRTTITLDDDVLVQLESARARTGAGFKEVVNEALRIGLRVMETPHAPAAPHSTLPTSLGGCRFPDLDHVASALALAEGEDFR